jgi:FkbM family methyltransferase
MARSPSRRWTPKLRRHVQNLAHRFALHVGRYPPVDSLAHHLKTVLQRLDVDVVLDVGAHEGEFAVFLREIGYAGQIVSFEPVRSSFERLTAARGVDTGWHGENVALGDVEGEREINIYRGSVFNSFLESTDDGPLRFRDDTKLVRTERVRVRRLESVIDGILAMRPNAKLFVKIDTQGYDLRVVRGAGPRLDAIRGLQTEVTVRPTYADMPSIGEALAELDRLGFEMTGIFPVARDLDLRVIELDCVMCRRPWP